MKQPFVTLKQVKEIVKTYPTPFHLYDEKGILENIRRTKQAFSWNPGFQEYFAVKAAPTPGLLNLFLQEGMGLDCSSYTELMLAEALGASGNRIVFSSNCTPKEDFAYAHKLGAIINLDDYSDIDTIAQMFSPIPETICCRFNPGGYFSIGNDIMDNPKDSKYGFTKQQLFDGFRRLSALGVKHFGLHAFLASNTVTNDYYPVLAGQLFQLAVELHQELGVHIGFIDLSGGIGIPYLPEEQANDIFKIGEGVRQVYEQVLIPAGMGDISLMAELGRFMTGPYGCLIAQAMHEKKIYKNYIGLDACAVDLIRPAMYGAYHHITVLGKENAPADHLYDVTGGLCENNDKFAVDRLLPVIALGDYLCIHDTGAHGYSMGYNYNGKLRSAELLLKEDGSVQLLRRAETPKDYFSTLDFLHLFE